MAIIEAETRISLKTILYLTDFSQPSRAALSFARALGGNYDAKVIALHVLIPTRHDSITNSQLRATLVEVDEEIAQAEMQQVDSWMAGLVHQTLMDRGTRVWPSVEQAIRDNDVNLIVLGTHGRVGIERLRLGSVAEEIFRRSPVPVLTIGPEVYGGAHSDARFRRVLVATDFEHDSQTAVSYAISLAQENRGQLILLHVINGPQRGEGSIVTPSVAETMHELYELIPGGADPWCRSEALVKYGEPSKQIVETAKQRGADLIVLGVRDHAGSLEITTHLERTTAHKVVVHAPCPVLTVRGTDDRTWLK